MEKSNLLTNLNKSTMKTKTLLTVYVLAILLVSGISSDLFSQTIWDKNEINPILQFGETGDWDESSAYMPRVIYHDNMYKMYYSGNQGDEYHVGLATSDDGVNWVKDATNPIILEENPGAWDVNQAVGTILLIDDTLRMWYEGWAPGEDNYMIGNAWSLDGYRWHVTSCPVLENGNIGSWDEKQVLGPNVQFSGSIYHMWYTGSDNNYNKQIGYATSVNGIDWIKYHDNPIIEKGAPETFYGHSVCSPYVIFDENKYKMWFNGRGLDGYTDIGYAESINRVTWDIYPNEVLSHGDLGAWDMKHAHNPCVMIEDGIYRMWYGGYDLNNWQTGYAEGFEVAEVPEDYSSITEAINAEDRPAIILVDTGIYYENINFKGKAITVASKFILNGDASFIPNTIIDGSLSKNLDSASVVCFISGEDTNSVLCGFTIQKGTGTYNPIENVMYGGGIVCINSSAKIINNHIVNNQIDHYYRAYGGGIEVYDTTNGNYLILRNNIIMSNRCESTSTYPGGGIGGGVDVWRINNVIIENNEIRSNTVDGRPWGAGITLSHCAGIVRNNNIIYNIGKARLGTCRGGGIYIENNLPGLTIANNTIVDNQMIRISGGNNSGGGIGALNTDVDYYYNDLNIENNIIKNNFARNGGGIYLRKANSAFVSNNLIVGNQVSFYGGGVLITSTAKNEDSGSGRSLHNDSETKEPYIKIPALVNNTIIENSSGTYGGGICSSMSNGKLLAFNNIIYDNTADVRGNAIYLYSGNVAHLYNNDVNTDEIEGNGSWKGNGNIFVDPMIIDDMGHLGPASECVNAGIDKVMINNVWYEPASTDFENETRPCGSTTHDIGMDETPYLHVNIDEKDNSEAITINAYPNPFSTSTTIEYTVKQPTDVQISIYNYLGEQIDIIQQKLSSGKQQVEWNTNGLPSGVYFCVLKTREGTQTKKIIKLK